MEETKGKPWRYKSALILLLYILAASSLIFMWLAPAVASRFGVEDGPAENITAFLMLAASIIMLLGGLRSIKTDKQIGAAAILMAVAFFVFAGEEISWGQRIFSIEPGSFMQQYNWQGETNLHNLHTDVSNILFHYGALVFLIVAPIFRNRIMQLTKRLKRLSVIDHFIPPSWIAAPSFVLLGMLDSRFVFIIEEPWAAFMYLFALAVGLIVLAYALINSLRAKNNTQAGLLVLSLLLVALGIFVSYVYAVDEQATNIISEFKELFIASGLFVFALEWRASKSKKAVR